MTLAKHWVRDFAFGKKGEEIVYRVLEKRGYDVVRFEEPPESKELFTLWQKLERARDECFKPDAIIRKDGKSWFCDVKRKGKESSLGIVNVRDYDKYWIGITKRKAKMLIFFLIDPTKEIYVHEVRDPTKKPLFPTKWFSDGETYKVHRSELTLFDLID